MPALMEILQSDYILAQVPEGHGPGPALLTSPGIAPRGRTRDLCLYPGPDSPAFSCFLFSFIQVQAIRLLSCLAQKNDLLYDILNCQVRREPGGADGCQLRYWGRIMDSPDRLSNKLILSLCTRCIENHHLFILPIKWESILLGGLFSFEGLSELWESETQVTKQVNAGILILGKNY